MADSRELQIILNAKDNATKEMARVTDALKNVDGAVKNTSSSFGGMTMAVAAGNFVYNTLAGLVTKVASGMTGLISESIELSGKLDQSRAVIYKLGENNSWTKKQIDSLVASIRLENKDMLTAIELTKTAIMTRMSESQALEIVAKGRDVAAASNRNSNDAIKAMMESIVKLRPELLSEYGIEINLVKVYQDFAKAMNIKTSEMTYAQKTQAMYNAVVGEATRMQGAYHESLSSWFKLSNSLKDGLINIKLIIGELLDDAMGPIIKYTYDAVNSFKNWAFTSENEVNPKLKEIAKVIGEVVMIAFKTLIEVVKGIVDAFKLFTNWIRESIEWIGKHKTLLEMFRTAWDNVALVFRENLQPALERLWVALQPLLPYLEVLAKVIGTVLLVALVAVAKILEVSLIVAMQVLTNILDAMTAVVKAVSSAWEYTVNIFKQAVDWAQKLIDKLNQLNIVQGAKNAISGAFTSVSNFITGKKAGGGSVSAGGAYLVGEEGPELFTPNASGNITPNNKLMGNSVNIYISGNTLLDGRSAEKIGDLIIKKLKMSNALG